MKGNTLALVLAVLGFAEVRADWAVVVDPRPFASVEQAAQAEEQVNWLDDKPADDSACTQCFAAVELARYLRQMTGRPGDFVLVTPDRLPACDLIVIGGPRFPAMLRPMVESLSLQQNLLAELGPEGYQIRSGSAGDSRVIVVAGGGRVGALYGVYDLLYRLGCRWFAPGEVHEEVPHLDALPEINVQQRPSFASRGFLAWEDRGNREFLLWMARNRLDYWCVEQRGHGLMRKLGIRMVAGLHDAEELFLNPSGPYPYDHPRFAHDKRKPKDPYAVSPEYQGDADRDGKLSYFEAHPEWFAFVGTRRAPGIKGMFGTNYCTSNPDATTEFMKNYVQSLVDGPYRDADIVRFWTLDGGRWCQCPRCRAQGTPTDRNLLLVHRLGQEIKRARAEGKIHRPISMTFLAYADVLDPPTRPLPAGFDYETCAATFYPIVRCFVHAFDDPACAANDRYRQQLRGWATDPARHYRGQICIGEYYNVSVYKSLPIGFMHTMARDIPDYYSVGARHFDYMHVTTKNWGSKALTNYQMARQLWDVGTDCHALWADYFAKRYGPAAGPMRACYESLDEMLSNATELKYGLARRLQRGAAELFPHPQMRYRREPGVTCDGPTLVEMIEHGKRCREQIDRARAILIPARIRVRIAEDEVGLTYAQRTLAYYDTCVRAFQQARAGRTSEARRCYTEARQVADLLRSDTEQTAYSSSHANACNAFEATLATGALEQLAKLLGKE